MYRYCQENFDLISRLAGFLRTDEYERYLNKQNKLFVFAVAVVVVV